jgi:hypothetical protein
MRTQLSWYRVSKLRFDLARHRLVGSLVCAAAVLFPWFALASMLARLIGLAVPVAMIEGESFAGSSSARAHTAASIRPCGGVSRRARHPVLPHTFRPRAILESQADNTVRTAIFLADTVLSLLFLGAALLYVDQDARLRSRSKDDERSKMPTYLMLTTLTEKGVQTLHANPDRLREVNRDVEEMGAKVLHQWAALGEYDFVNIVEAPTT